MRSSVAELSWAHIYKVKGSENGLVAQIIKVKHFKVKDISVEPPKPMYGKAVRFPDFSKITNNDISRPQTRD